MLRAIVLPFLTASYLFQIKLLITLLQLVPDFLLFHDQSVLFALIEDKMTQTHDTVLDSRTDANVIYTSHRHRSRCKYRWMHLTVKALIYSIRWGQRERGSSAWQALCFTDSPTFCCVFSMSFMRLQRTFCVWALPVSHSIS